MWRLRKLFEYHKPIFSAMDAMHKEKLIPTDFIMSKSAYKKLKYADKGHKKEYGCYLIVKIPRNHPKYDRNKKCKNEMLFGLTIWVDNTLKGLDMYIVDRYNYVVK
jgi:hypothetical protein